MIQRTLGCPLEGRILYFSDRSMEAGSLEIFDLRGQVKSGQRGSGQNRPTDVARDMVLLSHLLLIRQVCFRSPTPWSAFQDVTVVQQTVEHGGDGRAVTEQFAPVFHRAVRSK